MPLHNAARNKQDERNGQKNMKAAGQQSKGHTAEESIPRVPKGLVHGFTGWGGTGVRDLAQHGFLSAIADGLCKDFDSLTPLVPICMFFHRIWAAVLGGIFEHRKAKDPARNADIHLRGPKRHLITYDSKFWQQDCTAKHGNGSSSFSGGTDEGPTGWRSSKGKAMKLDNWRCGGENEPFVHSSSSPTPEFAFRDTVANLSVFVIDVDEMGLQASISALAEAPDDCLFAVWFPRRYSPAEAVEFHQALVAVDATLLERSTSGETATVRWERAKENLLARRFRRENAVKRGTDKSVASA